MRKRADYVPAEPVRKALRAYLRENGHGDRAPRGEWRENHEKRKKYSEAHHVVAEKTGVTPDAVYRWSRSGYPSMHFDVADRILAATDQVNLWWQDPELSRVYGEACQGADRIYPLGVAA